MLKKKYTSYPSHYWKNANFNPWGKHIGDCAIRAITLATGLDYRIVCKRLHVSYKNGVGLIRESGIDLDVIETAFNEYFDIVEDFYDNLRFVPPEMEDSPEAIELADFDEQNAIDDVSGITLQEFVSDFKDQGVFLVSLVNNPNASYPPVRTCGGHIVCVRCVPGKSQYFVDTFDSHEMRVDAYMRLKKSEPANSPLHWKFDKATHKFIV